LKAVKTSEETGKPTYVYIDQMGDDDNTFVVSTHKDWDKQDKRMKLMLEFRDGHVFKEYK
jgi:hypothetical protein